MMYRTGIKATMRKVRDADTIKWQQVVDETAAAGAAESVEVQ